MSLRPMSLACVALLLPAAVATPVATLPGGDFSDASLWTAGGAATIADGLAKLGRYESDCSGPEGSGILGSVTSVLPIALAAPTKLEFDFRLVQTMDLTPYSGLAIQVVDQAGAVTTVGTYNPNPSYGICRTLTGHAVVPLLLPPGDLRAGFVRLAVYGDGYSDPFYIEMDNLSLGA